MSFSSVVIFFCVVLFAPPTLMLLLLFVIVVVVVVVALTVLLIPCKTTRKSKTDHRPIKNMTPVGVCIIRCAPSFLVGFLAPQRALEDSAGPQRLGTTKSSLRRPNLVNAGARVLGFSLPCAFSGCECRFTKRPCCRRRCCLWSSLLLLLLPLLPPLAVLASKGRPALPQPHAALPAFGGEDGSLPHHVQEHGPRGSPGMNGPSQSAVILPLAHSSTRMWDTL